MLGQCPAKVRYIIEAAETAITWDAPRLPQVEEGVDVKRRCNAMVIDPRAFGAVFGLKSPAAVCAVQASLTDIRA